MPLQFQGNQLSEFDNHTCHVTNLEGTNGLRHIFKTTKLLALELAGILMAMTSVSNVGNSLDSVWIGSPINRTRGIILFQIIPPLNSNPQIEPVKPLNEEVIQNFLQDPDNTRYMNLADKEWYLQLTSNHTFYFSNTTAAFFPQKGQLRSDSRPQQNLVPERFCCITVNKIQQAFLRDGIQHDDINKFVLVDAQCGEFPFTVGKVQRVNEYTVTISVYTQWEDDLGGLFEVLPGVRKEIPKELFLRKENVVTQKNQLTVAAMQFLKKKYHSLQ